MIKKGDTIELSQLPIVERLSMNNNSFQGKLDDLFSLKESYFQFIKYRNTPKEFKTFLFNPSFIFFGKSEICEKITKTKEGRIFCLTENFMIDYINAINHKEIKLKATSDDVNKTLYYKVDIKECKRGVLESIDNYNQGFMTEIEMNKQIIHINALHCHIQGKFLGTVQDYIL